MPGKPPVRFRLVAAIVVVGAAASYAVLASLPRREPTDEEIRDAIRTSVRRFAGRESRRHPALFIARSEHVPTGLASLVDQSVEVVDEGDFRRRYRGRPDRPFLIRIRTRRRIRTRDPRVLIEIEVSDVAFEPPGPHRHGQICRYTFRFIDGRLESAPSDELFATE
jgi:hypothetical protein